MTGLVSWHAVLRQCIHNLWTQWCLRPAAMLGNTRLGSEFFLCVDGPFVRILTKGMTASKGASLDFLFRLCFLAAPSYTSRPTTCETTG